MIEEKGPETETKDDTPTTTTTTTTQNETKINEAEIINGENGENEMNNGIEGLNKYNRLKEQYFYNKHNVKCVNCKRNVKTIFLTTYNSENNSRVLSARCGDTENPCNLNIEIVLNPVQLLDNIVKKEREMLNEYQLQIIKTKNDLLFGYITQDEAIEIFENTKILIKNTTVQLETYLIKLLGITHNTEKQKEILTKQTELYEHIQNFKTHITMFKSTAEHTHIKEAIELYINTILPITKELTNLKYSSNSIIPDNATIGEYDKMDFKKIKIYTHEQKEYTIQMMEDSGNKNIIEVIHFEMDNIVNREETTTIVFE